MGGDRMQSHLADLHGIQSELLVAIHFLTKEEQEGILKTAQPRMLGAREEGPEAILPARESPTFSSVALKVERCLCLFAISIQVRMWENGGYCEEQAEAGKEGVEERRPPQDGVNVEEVFEDTIEEDVFENTSEEDVLEETIIREGVFEEEQNKTVSNNDTIRNFETIFNLAEKENSQNTRKNRNTTIEVFDEMFDSLEITVSEGVHPLVQNDEETNPGTDQGISNVNLLNGGQSEITVAEIPKEHPPTSEFAPIEKIGKRFACPQCEWTGANAGVVKTHIKKKHK